MKKTEEHLSEELKSVRTGRASPSLVEGVQVSLYGQSMPLKQVANISASDAKTLTVSPWDPSAAAAIEKAIREDSKLDLNPVTDGKTIHIPIPPLTQERREQIVKQVNDKAEQAHIALRNIRHEILNDAKGLQKNKQVSEDDYHNVEKQLDAQLESFRAQIDQLADEKRKEIQEL
jgi:ribosome recycling factor